MRGIARHIKKYPAFNVIAFLCLILLYAPLIIIMIYSFNGSRSITKWSGLSLRWYHDVFFGIEAEKFQQAAIHSFTIAVIAASIATLCATSAALAMYRGGNFKTKSLSFALINLPIMVPEIITGVATLIFFSSIGFKAGLLTIIVAHTVFCIPFAYMPIAARLNGIDVDYEQAAMDLYADKRRAFRRVLLPLLLPGILSGFLLAFIISLDDFIITNFVKGAGVETLPTAIFGAVKTGIKPNIMAISTLLLVTSACLVTVFYLVGKGKDDS